MNRTVNALATLSLFLSPLLGYSMASSAVIAQSQTRPNVIVVITDDQGYGDISAHGYPLLQTPELDRLKLAQQCRTG